MLVPAGARGEETGKVEEETNRAWVSSCILTSETEQVREIAAVGRGIGVDFYQHTEVKEEEDRLCRSSDLRKDLGDAVRAAPVVEAQLSSELHLFAHLPTRLPP